jgi:tetratricopeptide (TPR) repeat protein
LSLPDRPEGTRRLPPATELDRYEGVRLFVERARAGKADFAVTLENAVAVVEICHRLDGLPLAIELAAARIKLLSPQALLGRLESRLNLLTGGGRDLPARQQTLRGTIAWSHDLLSPAEQVLFRRLAVFVGGWMLETAETVCDPDGDLDVLDGLASLTDKSLIRHVEQPDAEPRFVMLETIREFAQERLAAAEGGEADLLRLLHAEHFLALAQEAEPALQGADQARWLDRLEAEHDNLRAALGWAERQDDAETALRLASALARFWLVRGHLSEGRSWLERALAKPHGAAIPMRARALMGTGTLALTQGDYAHARARYEESLALSRSLGDQRGVSRALHNLGVVARATGDLARAKAFYEEGLALKRDLGDRPGMAMALGNLGTLAHADGDMVRAVALHEESLTLFRELGDIRGAAIALNSLGFLARARGDDERAVALFEESLALLRQLGATPSLALTLRNLADVARDRGDLGRASAFSKEGLVLAREVGDKLRIAQSLDGIAALAAAQGRLGMAVRLYGTASALRKAIDAPLAPGDAAQHERDVVAVRDRLGEPAFKAAWEAGQALPLEEAIAEALAELDDA